MIGRSWKTLTNLTVIVPQVYNIEKLCFIYIKCERSELLADISRYSGILDNNLLLSRTEFLRPKAQKLGMKFRRKLLPSALFKGNRKKS